MLAIFRSIVPVIILTIVAGPAMAQKVTYPPTNYDEAYRGQFHFSPPAGWMNDVNGVWFEDGVYHLTYQHFPYGLGDGPKYWGHATSSDLLHWTQQPIALAPDINVPGDCWSGSTVVDLHNTSGLQTGKSPVLVTIYTATSKGTCLAYSNDRGKTWQAYDGNPVDIGGPNGETRDPHVFWYEPGRHWVCAYYENGTSIYTSPDLKHWTKTSHLAFGFECPDMYELPVDGDPARAKWVLQDGAGDYLLGGFDGSVFTPDSGGPYSMDVGPDFYAAQTFYRTTFPDDRVVQLAWNSKPGNAMPNTNPWTHDATFPCELRLATFPEGIRLTRMPIAEIAKLYSGARHYGPQTLPAGQNLLDGRHSETCDIDLVIDAARSTAKTVTFRLANLRFTCDLANKTLLEHRLAPLDGRVDIRILRDWGQLEVFGNGGELSYSRQFHFTPGDGSLSITADGDLAVLSADFRNVKRTWPGKAGRPGVIIDDADPATTYSGTWNEDNSNFYFDSTSHYGNTRNGYFETTFTGTGVQWWGLVNVDLGKADIYIDGALAADGVDCYAPVRSRWLLFEKAGLANGSHTIKVVVTGSKNPASAGTALVHDCFVALGAPLTAGNEYVDQHR